MMSFLKKEGEAEESGASKSDLITLIVIAVLAVGGYFWYNTEKQVKSVALTEAESQYTARDLEKAFESYCVLAEECEIQGQGLRTVVGKVLGNYGVDLDSAAEAQIYNRYSSLDSTADAQQDRLDRLRDVLRAQDVVAARTEAEAFVNGVFLEQADWDSLNVWRAQFNLPPVPRK